MKEDKGNKGNPGRIPQTSPPESSSQTTEGSVVTYLQKPPDKFAGRLSQPLVPQGRMPSSPVAPTPTMPIPWGAYTGETTSQTTQTATSGGRAPSNAPRSSGSNISRPSTASPRSGAPANPADLAEVRANADEANAQLEALRPSRPMRMPRNIGDIFDSAADIDAHVEQSILFAGITSARSETSAQTEETVLEPLPPSSQNSGRNQVSSANLPGVPSPSIKPVVISRRPATPRPPVASNYPTKPIQYNHSTNSQLRSVSLNTAPTPSENPVEQNSVPSPAPARSELPLAKKVVESREEGTRVSVPLSTKPVAETASVTPPSRWGRFTSAVGAKLSAAKESVLGFVKKHKTGVTVAAATSLAAVTGAGGYLMQTNGGDRMNDQFDGGAAVDSTPAPDASAMAKAASTKPESTDLKMEPTTKKAPETTAPRKFVEAIEKSKSPMVQEIITTGETRLNGNILGNTMLQPFMGLADNTQKAELLKLQREINLGMGVFFNEHFGTPEKIAASLQNPELKNLYSTAKVMKEKGWAPASLTKEKYPEEYRLAVRIFEDSRALGLDRSTNPDPAVQARVNGNLFQAKKNGDLLTLKKADGSYHVVLETVFNIMDGKNVRQALEAQQHAAPGETPVQGPTETIKTDSPKSGENSPTLAPTHTMNRLPGGLRNTNAEMPRDLHTPHATTAAATTRPVATDDIDSGWDEIADQVDQMAAAKTLLHETLSLEVQLPAGLAKSELNRKLLTAAAEKLALLHPEYDSAQVVGLTTRYGYIGMSPFTTDTVTGACQVRLNKNFYRILQQLPRKTRAA